MSYILDALKRSEQERHQDQLPSFSAENMILQTNHKRTHWWPYVLIAVLLLNALLFGFYSWNKDPDVVTQVNIHSSEKVQAIEGNSKRHPISQRMAPPDNVLNKPKFIQPLIHRQAGSIATAPLSKATTQDVDGREDDYLFGTTVDEGLLIQPKSKVSSQFHDVIKTKVLIEARGEAKPAYVIKPPPVPQAKTEVQDPIETVQVDYFADIPLLSTLDIGFQRSIPELTFNSHIYSEQAGARRVMINNFYLREGQSFNGLDLIEIGEVYIKVSKDGTLFKLPVLRDWYGK